MLGVDWGKSEAREVVGVTSSEALQARGNLWLLSRV